MGRRLHWVLLAIVVTCCDDGETGPPHLGAIEASYQLEDLPERLDRLAYVALLDRPGEGNVHLVASSLDEERVWVLATAEVADRSLHSGSDRILLAGAFAPELVVLDANGDGNDDLLVRDRWTPRNDAFELGYWHERVWLLTDMDEPPMLLVDIVIPRGLDSPVGPSIWPVRGGPGDHGILALVLFEPEGFQVYGIGSSVLDADAPCTEVACLQLLTAGEQAVRGMDFAARTLADGSLAIAWVSVRPTGHLQSEWFLARTRCVGVQGGLECSGLEEWGLARPQLGFGFSPDDDGGTYVRVTRPEPAVAAGIEAWTRPGDVIAKDLDASFTPASCRTTGEMSWRLVGTASVPRSVVARDFGTSGSTLAGVYDLPGWSEPYLHSIASNPDRDRAFKLVWAHDADHADIIELPR